MHHPLCPPVSRLSTPVSHLRTPCSTSYTCAFPAPQHARTHPLPMPVQHTRYKTAVPLQPAAR
eukprot:508086-Rhodomonas_salina.2